MTGHWVLCVDDDEALLEGLELQLTFDHEVRTASSGAQGLALLGAHPDCAVIISDMRMPGMNGVEFLAATRVVAPDATRILLTGSSDLDNAISAINSGGVYRFLTKPTDQSTFVGAVRDGIAEWQRNQERVTAVTMLGGGDAAFNNDLRPALRQALAENQLSVHYQPIVDLRTGLVREFEALARWTHPAHGDVSPATFITLAERSGLIEGIGTWVLLRSCGQMKSWNDGRADPLSISINVSAHQLVGSSFPALLRDVLDGTGLDPTMVCVEITESALIDQPTDVIANLERIRNLGVEIALDDFGTGYATLTYLRNLPITKIKIDQTFTAGLGTDAKDTAIVESTIGLAHTLGLKVTAEGIETAAQLSALEACGCDLGQGYLLGRPGPASNFDVGRGDDHDVVVRSRSTPATPEP